MLTQGLVVGPFDERQKPLVGRLLAGPARRDTIQHQVRHQGFLRLEALILSQNGWEKWWWHDWLSDPELQAATPATRGIWMNLLGHMWVKSDHKLSLPIDRFCRLAGCSQAEFEQFLQECDEVGFCDMSRESNARITLLSRRRRRQNKSKENNRLRQERHRRNAKVTHTEAEAEAEAEAEREDLTLSCLKDLNVGEGKKGGSGGKERSPAKPAPVVEILKGLNTGAWADYEQHRRSIRARKLKPESTARLHRWLVQQGDEDHQAAIIDATIRNGWTGLFELKRDKHDAPQPKQRPRLPRDYYRPEGGINPKYLPGGRRDPGADSHSGESRQAAGSDADGPPPSGDLVDEDARAALRAIRAAAGGAGERES